MVEFFDINYELLDADGQTEILGLYSRFLNYFDPEIHVQIFLFNRKVRDEVLMSRFDIKETGDGFDELRREYANILKTQCARGNNGIIKSKYFVFGLNAESEDEAGERLRNIEQDIIRNFRDIGTPARPVDGTERLASTP